MTAPAPHTELDDDIQCLVEQAPPLSEVTRARLASLLAPVRDIAAAQQAATDRAQPAA